MMKVPNYHNAQIPTDKIEGYILSKTHPIGKTKALFFEHAGYTIRNRDLFIEDIYSILKENSVARKVETEYGIKYIVKGKIGERFGKPVAVITIWLVEEEDMKESDTVVVNKDISDYGIERGDIGVVVHIYEDKSAVEVEFVSGEGTTLGVMTLRSEDVRLMKKDEILHVRELHTA